MSDGKHHSPSGFFWGLLIGAAIGSLVSTKKGRKIIKELSEHGLESLENVMNLEEIRDVMDEESGAEEKIDSTQEMNPSEPRKEPEKKKPRFFKGLRKKQSPPSSS